MIVDIHCHVVYGIDDGAQTREDMEKMLLIAHENGVSHVVCTSHITPGEKHFPAHLYLDHLAEGQAFCDEQGLGMTLHTGSEILYTDSACRRLREGVVPTLDRTWAVLVEFWPDVTFDELKNAARLLCDEGMTVLFAHIERYKTMREIAHVEELKREYNVLMQMNCGTIIRRQGFLTDKWRDRVLEAGLIDMVASDAHNTTGRSCNLLACREVLAARYGVDFADDLCGGRQARLLGYST